MATDPFNAFDPDRPVTKGEWDDWRDNVEGYADLVVARTVRRSEQRILQEVQRMISEAETRIMAEVHKIVEESEARITATILAEVHKIVEESEARTEAKLAEVRADVADIREDIKGIRDGMMVILRYLEPQPTKYEYPPEKK